MTNSPFHWTDDVEKQLLAGISLDVPWPLIERFATLVRESSTADERIAAREITARLAEWGIPHKVHYPELFLSLPRRAELEVLSPTSLKIRAKTPAMSISTGDNAVRGKVTYVPTGFAKSGSSLFEAVGITGDFIEKIVLTEGLPLPGKVDEFSRAGVKAIIFISPGERIHEGICTTIWGAPDLDSVGRQPRIPVVSISKTDGEALAKLCGQETVEVSLKTHLDVGWKPCPVVVAEIPGTVEPEKFVLLHGHLDSWHVGIGDNATGNAAMLELARVFWQYRDKLRRSLRIAWWSGHSTGRYAGSTWYADTFGVDLEENCIADVNCDSPGCRWASSFEDLSCMAEAEELVGAAIRDVAGMSCEPERPPRAGDCSFNNLGITSFLMLGSTIPREVIKQKNLHIVGGCGGNIEWHTEDDTLQIADRDNLYRDLKVYASAVYRALNAPVLPFNYRRTVATIRTTLQEYQQAAGDRFDFGPGFRAITALEDALETVYRRISETAATEYPDGQVMTRINDHLLRLGRLLVHVDYAHLDRFRQEPALPVPSLPDLAPVSRMAGLEPDTHADRVLRTHLTRGLNRLVWTLREARRLAENLLREVQK